MTTASTPKGERRRAALIRAASELFSAGGVEAVTHRAVAQRAGLPLASTTYYFSSLDEVLVLAVEFGGRAEIDLLKRQLEVVSRRRRNADTFSSLLVEWLAQGSDAEPSAQRAELVARYERFVASVRRPEIRRVTGRLRAERNALVVELIDRCGREVSASSLKTLVAIVDGTLLSSLLAEERDPFAAVRDALFPVVDVLAPTKG
ncbi:TetR family transcriptional regulator [Hoyosella rhizosphaerae]|uniref:TetR/AcrR family transcriptional regulator n=1 Tax=Hoyosella rhizosphaerae TaxID=1755582 RepID=UPI0016671021|nr:TetR family transcriptional regulator [Hoyosella rhizosphaerae]MBN4928280.1 TetR family transcriptional regulator [Hoyosella rhizosphaerae]